MGNDIIQAQYEQLETIAQRFGKQAQVQATLDQSVQRRVQSLQAGGWQGRGAAAFFGEMNGEVLPAMRRMVDALLQAQRVTLQIKAIIRAAEEEAAAPFKGSFVGSQTASGAPPANSTPSGSSAPSKEWTGWDTAKVFGKTLLWSYKKRGELAMMVAARGQWDKMVRFVQNADGTFSALGSPAAKEAHGLPGHFTRFGRPAIDKSMRAHSVFEMIKTAVKGDGPFSARATQLLDDIKGIGGVKTSPLWSANGFLKNVKGPAVISTLVTLGTNIYEFGFGENKDKGLLSREFMTGTGADVSAGLGIVVASTAIGTYIGPGPGTVLGFVVGLGLQLLYDSRVKETWRGTVDGAVQRVGSGMREVWNYAKPVADQIGRAASDAWDSVTKTGADAGRGVVDTFKSLSSAGSHLISPFALTFGE